MKGSTKPLRLRTLIMGTMLSSICSGAAFAQQASPPSPPTAPDAATDADSEITVVARRRSETLTSAPVAVSAVGAAEIGRRGIVQIDQLAQSVPQLRIADGGVSTQGGLVLIRGIGVGESNPFADQAVSFNVDGVQLSRSTVRRLSEVDMAQVEVLKGPQALYFGKNSPAGIIIIQTADPTSKFEAGVNSSYEFVGDEFRGDGYVSGPLTDTLGARVAVYGSKLTGYFKNIATPSALYGPTGNRLPHDSDFGGRVTLKFDPSSAFSARLKVNYGKLISSGAQSSIQTIACPLGFAQLAPKINDCTADGNSVIADPGPRIAGFASELSPESYLRQTLMLGSFQMDYTPASWLKLTSITGYYRGRTRLASSLSVADTTNPDFIFANSQFFHDNEFSQEVRAASQFSGPLNFMIGGYYQDADLFYSNLTVRNNAALTVLAPKTPVTQKGKAYSVFGQLTWAITPQIELSGGGRYSYEKKDYAIFDAVTGAQKPAASPGNHWDNFSPEGTLAWRPSTNLTVYGAYKTGFLSGGFAVAAGNLALDRSYDQQTTKGYEAGIKGRLFGGQLRGSLIAYNYLVKGLQVTSNFILPNGTPDQRIVNAKGARTKGIELEMTYQPTPDFNLHGAVGYNHARYKDLTVPCYGGQSQEAGCNLDQKVQLNPTDPLIYTNQSLSGARMVRAPDWSIQGGVFYQFELGGGDTLGASVDANYSSGFFANPSNNPISWQKSYALLDAGLTYKLHSGLTVGVLGRNLTNRYYYDRAIDATLTGVNTGASSSKLAITPSDEIASVARGRQLLLRVSFALQ